MARYVDGFVIPVPKKKMATYKRMAMASARAWKKAGALQYVETVADDVCKLPGVAGDREIEMHRAEEEEEREEGALSLADSK